MATNLDVLNRYFDILVKCLLDNGIYNSPGRIDMQIETKTAKHIPTYTSLSHL